MIKKTVADQNLAGQDDEEVQTLLDELEADGDLSDILPDEEGKQAKISHAFALKGQKNKEAAALIKRQQEELDKYKKEKEEVESHKSSIDSGVGAAGLNQEGQLKKILDGLTVQAMQKLGVFQIVTPAQQEMVRMERDRLYLQQVNAIEAQAKAKENAPQVIEDTLSNYLMLSEHHSP